MKFCPECGTKRLTETSKFCSECGFSFEHNSDKRIENRDCLRTYFEGVDYPLEEMPVFHVICKDLKGKNKIRTKQYRQCFNG